MILFPSFFVCGAGYASVGGLGTFHDAGKCLQLGFNGAEYGGKGAARSHLDVYSKAETDTKDSTLSVRMEAINTDLLAKSVATNARIGYSLLTVTNPALNSRTVVAN